MKYRILSILVLMAMAAVVGFAGTTQKASSTIPTPDEIRARMPKIKEATKSEFSALKEKKKTHVETAEKLLGYVDDSDNPADKFVLRQMAFSQYVLGAAFDKADELYSAVRAENGIEYAVGVVGDVNITKVPKRLKEQISNDKQAIKNIRTITARLEKSPENAKLHEQLALAYAVIGDWESALFKFRDCKGDDVSKVAAWELSEERNGDYDATKVAEFWWDFASNLPKGKQAEVKMVKAHAANWYKKAMALNLLSGLDATVANNRIEECEAFAAQTPVKEKEKRLYMVVDLTKSTKAKAITYLDEAPKDGWSDEYRTTKIVLRKIAPGSFEYSPGKSFTITKPFYIGVFEVTQKQYEMLMKDNPSEFKGALRPVEKVSYVAIRGSGKGREWPKSNKVDDSSYLGKLRNKTSGLEFDLPTEVQWEYACRAGTNGAITIDKVKMDKLGKYEGNGGQSDYHVKVGSYMPNAWGLYDMYGNVWELCLDRGKGTGQNGWIWFDWTESKETDKDPRGPAEGKTRILRGGSWADKIKFCIPPHRGCLRADECHNGVGFRLACPAETAK